MMQKAAPTAAMLFLLLSLAMPLVGADTYTIAPGGTYIVNFNVKKPAFVNLNEGKWQVRVYFYTSTSCYNDGSWWQASGDWIYSGWYEDRYIGEAWGGSPETKEHNVSTKIVSYPRPAADIDHGMTELPLGSTVNFRLRVLLELDKEPVFSGGGETESGVVSFMIGGTAYQYQYTVDFYGDTELVTSNPEKMKISQSSSGVWQLTIDRTLSASTSESASKSGIFILPDPLEIDLASSASPEQSLELPLEVKIVSGITVSLVVAGLVAYIAMKKHGGGEIFVEH